MTKPPSPNARVSGWSPKDCHFEGCQEEAKYTCTTPGYPKESGCKKRFCAVHRSKLNFVIYNDYRPIVCINCEVATKDQFKGFETGMKATAILSACMCIICCIVMALGIWGITWLTKQKI